MDIYPGLIVISTAGRDKDKYFVILSCMDDTYCMIADGNIRKVDRPKKKKIKHLKVTNHSLDRIREKFETGQTVTNSMIRKELKQFTELNET